MAVLAIIAAFMIASYVARNSDQWLHYASGRALLDGSYQLGSDPFSHATAGRYWVNHSWLSSVAMYLLYNTDPTGFAIVCVKAFLFAATFAILFLLRPSGQTLWPWVLATAIALVAAAPHTGLRPIIASGLFLAITLYILLGRDWKSARWNTAALGILFWFWAGTDSWFLLGPATIAIVLLGESLQKFLRGESPADSLASPTVPQLFVALIVGIVACSLTPHHVRVWQLPVEFGLTLPANYQSDFETTIISLSPLNDRYLRVVSRGWSVNGLAFVMLLVGGGLALAVGFARLRVAHLLLWLAFAGLALLHYRLILFFTIVAVPIFATALAGLTDSIPLGPPDSPRAKLLVLLSSVGRLIAFPFTLMLLASAYPGWLHPGQNHPSMVLRCSWGVAPDPGLRRSAEMLQQWRESGKLPDDYLGIAINFDLANHLAWFAPKEKVYVNGRYGFHAPDLEEFIAARRIFLDRQFTEQIEKVEIENFREFCHKHGMTYVAYSGLSGPPATRVDTAPLYQLSGVGEYSLWHVDGRLIVLGDPKSKQHRLETFRGLAFNPIRLAFHPELALPVKSPPDGIRPISTEPTFLDPFIMDLPKPPPLEALDAAVWDEVATKLADMDFYRQTQIWTDFAAAVGNRVPAVIAAQNGYKADDLTTAYHFLALRAAFRAIAENPEYPESYLVIAQSGGFGRGPNNTGIPASIPGLQNRLKQRFEIAGLRQYLDLKLRETSVERAGIVSATQIYLAAVWLHSLYQPPAALDRGQAALPESARDILAVAQKFLPRTEMAMRDQKMAENILKAFEQQSKRLDMLTVRANDRYQQQFKNLELHQQLRGAIDLRLFSQARAKFEEAMTGWPESMGPEPLLLIIKMIDVFIQLGQLDEADYYLREVERNVEQILQDSRPGQQRAQAEGMKRLVRELRMELWQCRGDFEHAGEAMEQSIKQLRMSREEVNLARRAVNQPNLQSFSEFVTGYAMRQDPDTLFAVTGCVAVGDYMDVSLSYQKWQSHIELFIYRGLLNLLEGKPAEARFRFEQALRPEKIEVPRYLPQRDIAEQYIRMIDQAAK